MQFDHFTIRLFEHKDAAGFFRLMEKNRSRLEDYFSGTVSKTLTAESTELYMHDVVNRINKKEYMPFAVIDTGKNEIVGFVDVKRIDWHLPKGELGCFFDSDYLGKGLSKKALSAVIDYFFTELGFNKFSLRTHETNKPARALAESCGFKMEGLLRKDHRTTKGEVIDLIYYGLVRE